MAAGNNNPCGMGGLPGVTRSATSLMMMSSPGRNGAGGVPPHQHSSAIVHQQCRDLTHTWLFQNWMESDMIEMNKPDSSHEKALFQLKEKLSSSGIALSFIRHDRHEEALARQHRCMPIAILLKAAIPSDFSKGFGQQQCKGKLPNMVLNRFPKATIINSADRACVAGPAGPATCHHGGGIEVQVESGTETQAQGRWLEGRCPCPAVCIQSGMGSGPSEHWSYGGEKKEIATVCR